MSTLNYEVEISPSAPQDYDFFVNFLDDLGDALYADARISTVDMATEGAERINILMGIEDATNDLLPGEMAAIAESALNDAFALQGAHIEGNGEDANAARHKTLVMQRA